MKNNYKMSLSKEAKKRLKKDKDFKKKIKASVACSKSKKSND
jgi:hypothetical protein